MTLFDKDIDMAKQIAQKVSHHGGRTYYVGGYVRDQLLGKPNKDVDIEVHGIAPKELESVLDSLGERISVGESFGIYNLKGYSIDVAMPRKEKARGTGHKDFDVVVDPFAGTLSAAKRRDFTINAFMQDVLTGEIIDHFEGRSDLKARVLRHVNDESFIEDPLRVLRAAQFAARFEFAVASETILLCERVDLNNLSKERIEGELRKALLKANKPSIFFETLRKMNQLTTWFPELQALIDVQQSPKHHQEGDVWTHTMMVLDEAVKFRERVSNPFGYMLSAITHDFGKALCTEVINGEIHAYKHESQGLGPAEQFLRRITSEVKLIEYVLNLTELHMAPNIVAEANSSIKATNKMFDQSIDPVAIICLALADGLGKLPQHANEKNESFLYERLAIYNEYMSRPYVMGRDLVEQGVVAGKDFSEYLEYAHKLRLAGVDKESALRQVLAYVRKNRKLNANASHEETLV